MKRLQPRGRRSEVSRLPYALCCLVSVLWVLTTGWAAETNSPAAKAAASQAARLATPIPRSVFLMPKSRVEGVDPFFPLSTRLAAAGHDGATNRPAALHEPAAKGF